MGLWAGVVSSTLATVISWGLIKVKPLAKIEEAGGDIQACPILALRFGAHHSSYLSFFCTNITPPKGSGNLFCNVCFFTIYYILGTVLEFISHYLT